jgi:hypothetical protein
MNEHILPFPMPNDRIGGPHGPLVVASVEYRDEPTYIATVLLLWPEAPYFEVAHFYQEDCPAEGDIPGRPAGRVLTISRHENIVPAVEEYQQMGGDY